MALPRRFIAFTKTTLINPMPRLFQLTIAADHLTRDTVQGRPVDFLADCRCQGVNSVTPQMPMASPLPSLLALSSHALRSYIGNGTAVLASGSDPHQGLSPACRCNLHLATSIGVTEIGSLFV